jgi:hypothetical protein
MNFLTKYIYDLEDWDSICALDLLELPVAKCKS